jgi:hypothetical protein
LAFMKGVVILPKGYIVLHTTAECVPMIAQNFVLHAKTHCVN